MSLIHKVEQYIRKEQLLEPGTTVLVAVSGGPDSTALLHVLAALAGSWRLTLHVAHMEHGFRDAESRREAEWVKQLAEQLKLPCTVQSVNIPHMIATHGGNPQDVARQERYKFLLSEAANIGADRIALGHHADDQAETIIMRLLRGSSLRGLSGMSPVTMRGEVKLVRPLLRINKEELIAFLDEHHYSYCVDSSNEERKYTRNRLRLEVMPQLKTFNPEFVQGLSRMADIVRDEDRLLQRLAQAEFERLFQRRDRAYSCSREDWLKLDVALQRRVIKLILSYLCFHKESLEMIHIEQVREAIESSTPPTVTLHLPGMTFIREYEKLTFVFGTVKQDAVSYSYEVAHANETLLIPEAGVVVDFALLESETLAALGRGNGFAPHSAYFDMEQISFPLTVRNRRPGDRIHLMNMQGTTKLKDLFIDLKVPHSERSRVPLVFDAEGRLLWICGIRRSREAPVHETVKKVLRIKVEPNVGSSNDIDYLGG